ncbi:MAG: YceI family protein [Chitinophagaceae bacterium]|nr:YceI family protein [Chitinophagaceae bacterium]
MKKSFLSIAVLAVVLATSCQQAPEAAKAETTEKQEAASVAGATAYTIDTTTSSVGWLGTKPVGKHNGDFKLSGGSLSVEAGVVKGGNFVIDINSIKNLDLTDAESNGKLIGHLKSPDFFDAAKFPTAKFEITSVEALQNDSTNTHKISGNLTLKDSTKNVTFPAKIIVTDNNVKALASFNIDRTNWGLRYGNDQSLGDKFIHPEVNISLDIEARK